MPPLARLGFLAVDWNGTVVPFFGLPPYPGALAGLEELRRKGLRLVVVSCAAPAEILADVQRVGVQADEVHGCSDKGPVLAELVRRLGPGVLVGDHPADLRAAREARVVFIQARPEEQELLDGVEHSFVFWPELPLLLDKGTGAGAVRSSRRAGWRSC